MSISIKSKVALGTVQFGLDYGISNNLGKTKEKEVSKILDLANRNDICLLDTAQAYGSSEEALGKFHQNRFKIVTKLDSNLLAKDSVSSLINTSLKKLKVKSIYGVLFHSLSNSSYDQEVFQQLVNLKDKEIIKKVGFSAYTPVELEIFINKFGNPDILQIPYNIVDRRFEKMIFLLHKEGVEIHSRSTFLQGLFFMDSSKLSSHFNKIKPFIKTLKTKFKNSDELAGFLLKDVLNKHFIDKVIIGVNNLVQLSSILDNLNTTSEDINSIPLIDETILNPSQWPKN